MKNVILLTWLTLLSFIVLFPSSNIIAQDFCKGDFNYDGNVDATDVSAFLQNFGRSRFNNPCPSDGPTPVSKTGQTTSYGIGDDGNLEKGVPWPNPRFTDNSDGTITNKLTGLIWLKDANCFGTRTWTTALSDCNELQDGVCGLREGSNAGDWRLPNLFELESLRDMKYYGPALSNTAGTGQWSQGNPFTNVQSSLYWSSTTYTSLSGDPSTAWTVNMTDGVVYYYSKYIFNTYYVWPVRGGQ